MNNAYPHVYGPFIGGVDYSRPSDDISPDTLYDGQNIRINPDGSAEKRPNTEPFIDAQLNSGAVVTSIGQHQFSASSEREYAMVGDKFYENVSGTWTDRSGSATMTAGQYYELVDANGTLIGHNGNSGDTIVKWTAAGGNLATLDVDSRFTTAKHWEFFDNRAFAGNLNVSAGRVWRSDAGDIETWDATAFYNIGETVTGLKRLGDSLAIHTKDSINMLVPTGNATVPYRRLPKRAQGTVAGRSIQTVTITGVGEVQVYVRNNGIFAFDGESSTKISQALDGDRYWNNVNTSALSNAFSLVYEARDEVWFFLPYGASQTTMNHIMIFNYRQKIWYPPFKGVTRACGAIINEKPHAGSYDGYVHTHAGTNVDDDDGSVTTAVDAWGMTSSRAPDHEASQVRWLFSKISYEVAGNYEMQITFSNPTSVSGTKTITISGGLDAIGSFQIGTSVIGGNDLVANDDIPLTGYGPHIQIKFRNANSNEKMVVRKITSIFRSIGVTRTRRAGVV